MKMEKYNLVPRAKKSIEEAIEVANKYKHQKVNSAHLFYALLNNSTTAIKNIFNHFKINVDALKNCLVLELPQIEPSFFQKTQKTEDWWSEDLERSRSTIVEQYKVLVDEGKISFVVGKGKISFYLPNNKTDFTLPNNKTGLSFPTTKLVYPSQ